MARRAKRPPVFDDKDVQEAADAVLKTIEEKLPNNVVAMPIAEEVLVNLSRDTARFWAIADGTSTEWTEGFAKLVARRVSFRLPELLQRLRKERGL